MRKHFTLKNLITFLTGLAIVLILFWRFKLAMSHFFDVDELNHLFRAWLISAGETPYKDFGYGFSPLFASFFSPLFLFFKENVSVVFWARGLNFLIFTLTLLLVFLIGKLSFSPSTGLLAAFFWAFFPVTFIKSIEIRPDLMAILFWLVSFYFLLLTEKEKRKKQLILLSGLCFGFSILISPKMIFGYPGLMVFLFVKIPFKKNLNHFFLFHLGVVVPGIILILSLLFIRVLKEGLYCIVTLPREVQRAYGKKYFDPAFPLLPNDTIYGLGGKSSPWLANIFVFFLGILALIKQALEMVFKKTQPVKLFLLVSFVSFAGAILFVYNITLVQYYLPMILVICLALAELLTSVKYWPVIGVFFLLLLLFALRQLVYTHLNWTNAWQVALMKNILRISQPQDYFFDMTGYHLFRKSSYWHCCDPFPQWEKTSSRPLPRVADELVRTQTKFIIQTGHLRALSPEDKAFIEDNFHPSEFELIWVAD